MFFANTEGVIYSFDPATEFQTAIVNGPDPYFGPTPSRNGQRLAFHSGVSVGQILVADVDGSNVHAVDGTYTDFREMDWSPDNQQLRDRLDRRRCPVGVDDAEADGSGAHDRAARP